MTTGYEVQMYNDLRQIQLSLNRIADCMEAAEARAQVKPVIDPDSLGVRAIWQQEVAAGDTILGFTEWLAWIRHDEEKT